MTKIKQDEKGRWIVIKDNKILSFNKKWYYDPDLNTIWAARAVTKTIAQKNLYAETIQ